MLTVGAGSWLMISLGKNCTDEVEYPRLGAFINSDSHISPIKPSRRMVR